jgi:hypothetical protein
MLNRLANSAASMDSDANSVPDIDPEIYPWQISGYQRLQNYRQNLRNTVEYEQPRIQKDG